MSVSQRVPVTVLTGFLGSGKTTLLNRILTENHGQRIAVIENEFGEIGVDQELVINAEEEIFETNNGCICCTVRGDLIRILGNLMARRDRFDRVVLETTGLANPGPVAQTFFVDEAVRGNFALDGIVTLVDASHFEQQLADSEETRTQVAFADVVVINKTDLVADARLDEIERRIRSMNAMARIVRSDRAVRAGVAMAAVLGIGGFDLARALEYQPTFLEPEYPFEWAGLFELGSEPVELRLRPGPDPSMKVAFFAALAGERTHPAAAAERIFRSFSGAIEPAAEGATLDANAGPRDLPIGAAEEVRFRLKAPRPGAYWLFTQHLPSEFDLRLVDARRVALRAGVEKEFAPGHSHDARVGSLSLESSRPMDPRRFEAWISAVLRDQGTRLYRLKGFVNFEGRDDRIVLQGVHMSLDTSTLGPWGERQRLTQLVFIGRELDRASLEAGFHSCET